MVAAAAAVVSWPNGPERIIQQINQIGVARRLPTMFFLYFLALVSCTHIVEQIYLSAKRKRAKCHSYVFFCSCLWPKLPASEASYNIHTHTRKQFLNPGKIIHSVCRMVAERVQVKVGKRFQSMALTHRNRTWPECRKSTVVPICCTIYVLLHCIQCPRRRRYIVHKLSNTKPEACESAIL